MLLLGLPVESTD